MANASQTAYVILKSRYTKVKQAVDDFGTIPTVIKFLYTGNSSLSITDSHIIIRRLVGDTHIDILRLPYDRHTESVEVTLKDPKFNSVNTHDVSKNLGDLDPTNFKAKTISTNTSTGTGVLDGNGNIVYTIPSSDTQRPQQINS